MIYFKNDVGINYFKAKLERNRIADLKHVFSDSPNSAALRNSA